MYFDMVMGIVHFRPSASKLSLALIAGGFLVQSWLYKGLYCKQPILGLTQGQLEESPVFKGNYPPPCQTRTKEASSLRYLQALDSLVASIVCLVL